MASLSTLLIPFTTPKPHQSPTLLNPRIPKPRKPQESTILSSIHRPQTLSITYHNPNNARRRRTPHKMVVPVIRAQATPTSTTSPILDLGLRLAGSSFLVSPPTWQSAVLSNLIIFFLGYPLLVLGLSLQGIGAAFLLGTLTWRAFGHTGFLLVATYFLIGTGATKVKMAQKEAQGVAEKKKGRRGPGSVIGSSAAGCVCAFLSILGVGGKAFSHLWVLGFVASFCTKLSDTVSSEIGKAYGKTTYLVTTFKIVPRGTEGAVSVEGTIAGLLASILLAFAGFWMGVIKVPEALICVVASQIANLGESVIGASLQDKEGFRWLNNDAVNVINISMGSILAVLIQQILLQNWYT